jgi:transcription elongation factor S-II
LRESVLFGEITPEHLATMTADEMASEEMKQVRERLAKEAFNDHQMSFVSGTQTDQFQCSNCKKYNTTYNEVKAAS